MASKKVKKALEHEDKYGAGARAREAADLSEPEEYEAIESERQRGTLHSGGSGSIVTNPKQAQAIAHSEFQRKRRKNNPDNDFVRGREQA